MSATGSAVIDGEQVRYTGPPAAPGMRVEQDGRRFTLIRDRPAAGPLLVRIDAGRVDFSDDPAQLAPPDTSLTPAVLLSLINGVPLAPEATPLPGLRRIMAGDRVLADATGVRVDEAPAPAAAGRRQRDLRAATVAVLEEIGEPYAIAVSGGLGSLFAAACARHAGHHPTLPHLHEPGVTAGPPETAAGMPVRPVSAGLLSLLDERQITGREPLPPLPEAALAAGVIRLAREAADGVPVVSGGLLEEIMSGKLTDARQGVAGWRLRTCEPFHASGRLPGLRAARAALAGRDEGVAPEAAADASGMPALTGDAQRVLSTVMTASTLTWQHRLERLPGPYGRAEVALEARGLAWSPVGDALLPALDARVLAAAAALRPAQTCRIRNGVLVNHWPLREVVGAVHTGPVRQSGAAPRARLLAAAYLHRSRARLAACVSRSCPLADLGIADAARLRDLLADGPVADYALPLLRLIWIDRWLRERA